MIYTFEGYFTDANGKAIAGATVRLQGTNVSVKTDNDGRYSMTVQIAGDQVSPQVLRFINNNGQQVGTFTTPAGQPNDPLGGYAKTDCNFATPPPTPAPNPPDDGNGGGGDGGGGDDGGDDGDGGGDE